MLIKALDRFTRRSFPFRGTGYLIAGVGVGIMAWFFSDHVLCPALFGGYRDAIEHLWMLFIGASLAAIGFVVFWLAPIAPVVIVQTPRGWFIRLSRGRKGPYPSAFAAARALESPILSGSISQPRT